MTTEATYPYAVGGVSSWCDLLINGLSEVSWQILPIVAGGLQRPAFELPAHAELLEPIELWSQQQPASRAGAGASPGLRRDLPGVLVRELLAWSGDPAVLTEALVWCRQRPRGVRRVFRGRRSWEMFLQTLDEILEESTAAEGSPPRLDLFEAARLYQTLYWLARTAAAPTPATDVLHVTAAGWAVVPALVHKALHGTPLLLTEHGVYVREAYLAAARSKLSAGERFISTRLARGLTRAAYSAADMVLPVTDANARWEEGLGVDPDKIRVIYNGVELLDDVSPCPPPRTSTVVSVGRIDPLKDVHLMLRVAAEVLRRVPEAQFVHYGPVTDGQEAYGRSCNALHQRAGLGDRFRFMGSTNDPLGAVRAADVVLMTSISEGLPLSILEAMAQARPVVATRVGGVSDVVRGCGMARPPGDVHGLALAVSTLLRNPGLASRVGQRGRERVRRIFTRGACLDAYRQLLEEITATAGAT